MNEMKNKVNYTLLFQKKMKTKATQIVMVALIAVSFFAPIVNAETAEEWNEKGVSFVKAGEYEKATECFDKAIELDPMDAEAYHNRGLAYYALAQYGRAIEDFDKAVELDPNCTEAHDHRELALSKTREKKPTQSSMTTPEKKGVEGFEVVFAIIGLLAVAYILITTHFRH